jgi:hypothetical protein
LGDLRDTEVTPTVIELLSISQPFLEKIFNDVLDEFLAGPNAPWIIDSGRQSM